MNPQRSMSVGALPREKKHYVSRNESAAYAPLDVRCACQYFQCDSLLPERAVETRSRPTSKLGFIDEHGQVHELQYAPELLEGTTASLDMMSPMMTPPHFPGSPPPTSPAFGQSVGGLGGGDQLSMRSFNIRPAGSPYDMERASMRSVPTTLPGGVVVPPLDLTFVEKYPELEETARARGLVVHNIAVDPPQSKSGRNQRRRLPSVGGMSTTSGITHDAISVRSGVSGMRRISRSPSKTDLFVADINIKSGLAAMAASFMDPVGMEVEPDRGRPSRRSFSRRLSNMEPPLADQVRPLTISPSPPPPMVQLRPPQQQQQQLAPPIPTPGGQETIHAPLTQPDVHTQETMPTSPAYIPSNEYRSSPVRAVTPPQRGRSHTPTDYRVARPPASTDYMRPSDEAENRKNWTTPGIGMSDESLLPQHRPIDLSPYDPYASSTQRRRSIAVSEVPVDLKTWNLKPEKGEKTKKRRQQRAVSPSADGGSNAMTAKRMAASPTREIPMRTTAFGAMPPDPKSTSPQRGRTMQRGPASGAATGQSRGNTTLQRGATLQRDRSPYHEHVAAPSAVLRSTSPSRTALEETVLGLEEIRAAHNVVDIIDNIRVRQDEPAPSIAGDLSLAGSLHPGEQININIVSAMEVVQDVDRFIAEETEKVLQEREQRGRGRSPQPPAAPPFGPAAPLMQGDTTRMMALNPAGTQRPTVAMEQSLKRDLRGNVKTDGAFNTASSITAAAQIKKPNFFGPSITTEGLVVGEGAPLETKSSSVGSRIKSMFSGSSSSGSSKHVDVKKKDIPTMATLTVQHIQVHNGSASGAGSVAASGGTHSKTPSPKLMSRLKSVRGRSPSMMQAMSIVSGSTAGVISRRADAEPMSVKVTETFSLKVDDMDQYSSRPSIPPPSARQSTTNLFDSREPSHRGTSECGTSVARMDMQEAFAPIILGGTHGHTAGHISGSGSVGGGGGGGAPKFMAGHRSLYASEIRAPSETRTTDASSIVPTGIMPQPPSRDNSVPPIFGSAQRGAGQQFVPVQREDGLISMPISLGSQSPTRGHGPGHSQFSMRSISSSSAERAPLPLKSSTFNTAYASRTQSQDRTRISASQEQLFGGGSSMTKTVSFNFDDRKSRLSDFEKRGGQIPVQQQREKREFLDRTYFSRDHEYEPIGQPISDQQPSVPKPATLSSVVANDGQMIDVPLENRMRDAEDMQRDLEERYFSSATTTPRTESRTDYDLHTSQVDTSALEELPLQRENRRKGFMASAHDRTKKMQAGFKTQAGKLRTKLKAPTVKKSAATGSPKGSPKHQTSKERRRFKAPEFASKLKMPELKRPDMSKLKDFKGPDMSKFKDFKRPEFTKFNKPDMSKFKLPEKLTTLKLRRSKSLKENEGDVEMENQSEITTPDSAQPTTTTGTHKKIFDFNFGTYPRAFRRNKKKPLEPQSSFGTEDPSSFAASSATQPSVDSTSSPQGDRGPGPVRSRWADKFSDVSYNDSEGSRYRRYGSEQESFEERESSLERRMMREEDEDDEEDEDEDMADVTSSETRDMGILGAAVSDSRQYAEFDEENRAIHEISSARAGEFKRRPLVHQDSDLRSEDSKDAAIGWTEREVQKNKLLRKAEMEAESSYLKYDRDRSSEEPHLGGGGAVDAQSTTSSGKKIGVLEEIDDDEFFLRKRGISEDNIELRQYISQAIREGYDMPVPINALQHVGTPGDYDVPPPKPRRLHKAHLDDHDHDHDHDHHLFQRDRDEDSLSREMHPSGYDSRRSDYGDELSMSINGSDYYAGGTRPPTRPARRSRSKHSVDSRELRAEAELAMPERYFDDDEEYLRPPQANYKQMPEELNNLDVSRRPGRHDYPAERNNVDEPEIMTMPSEQDMKRPAAAPRRRKRQSTSRDGTSMEKDEPDSLVNGFGGRSGSQGYMQAPEDVIVYRTKHEYDDPTTPNTTDHEQPPEQFSSEDAGSPAIMRKSRSRSPIPHDKFIIDMLESDGYAVVRKDYLPKPTPPARRKKFSRSPGERFSTIPPERPPPPREYRPSILGDEDADMEEEEGLTTEVETPVAPRRKSNLSLNASTAVPPAATIRNSKKMLKGMASMRHSFPACSRRPNNAAEVEDDYEEPDSAAWSERAESPRATELQSGEVIQRMKGRPLPPPPRPPRDRRQRSGGRQGPLESDGDMGATTDSYEPPSDVEGSGTEQAPSIVEVEIATQTDPLPDDFVCEEFEITADMKVIEPTPRSSTVTGTTLGEVLGSESAVKTEETSPGGSDEQLSRGLQRFRDANQRSQSEKSKNSSRSHSRPQTPSAVVIERRVSTPVPGQRTSDMMVLEASLVVQPIDDLDLEEEALRREGLLSDGSQHSRTDDELPSAVASATAAAELLLASASEEVEPSDVGEEDEEVEQAMLHSDDYDYEHLNRDKQAAVEKAWEREVQKRAKRSTALSEEEEEELETGGEEDREESYSHHRYDEHEEDFDLLQKTDEEALTSDYERDESDGQRLLHSSDIHPSEGEAETTEAEHEHEEWDQEVLRRFAYKPEPEHDEEIPAPVPPPRRKSASTIDEPSHDEAEEEDESKEALHDEVDSSITPTSVVMQPIEDFVTTPSSIQAPSTLTVSSSVVTLPSDRVREDMELLHAQAIQAGNLLHEAVRQQQPTTIDTLPPGFIEDLVERVRTMGLEATPIGPSPSIATNEIETQTSRQASNEMLLNATETTAPPPAKPPRHKEHTIPTTPPSDSTAILPPVYASTEYVSSVSPLAPFATAAGTTSTAPITLHNLMQQHEATSSPIAGVVGTVVATASSYGAASSDEAHSRQACHHHHRHHYHHHHHHHRRCSCSDTSDYGEDDEIEQVEGQQSPEYSGSGGGGSRSHTPHRHHSRSRSRTHPPATPSALSCTGEPESVVQAGKQFVTACSMSLVRIINQLTSFVRGNTTDADSTGVGAQSVGQVSALVVLFMVITFTVLMFLMSGKQVHTHHWDYFNPPGNEGRK